MKGSYVKSSVKRRDFLTKMGKTAFLMPFYSFFSKKPKQEKRPNILWIYVEDTCPYMSCYGYSINPTLHLDKLASDGVRFAKAFMPTPVCSPCRSGIITGTMATTFGLHNHHSSRSEESAIYLPAHVKTIPEIFKEAGYFTFNLGKDDYNFRYDREKLYSGKYRVHPLYGKTGTEGDWRDCPSGHPFFGQIQLRGGKHVNAKDFREKVKEPIDPESIKLPPYYADHPVMRKEVADHYNTIRITDQEVGGIIDELKKAGLLDNTIVFFFTDHGMKSIRHKQFCYDGGLHVPLIVAWYGKSGKIKSGTVREDLVSGIDIGATSLALAGLDIPDYMEGHDLFAENYKSREYVIATRDRCDFTIDRIRAVRTERYKYIRNFLTDRPYMQPNYRDDWESVKLMRRLYEEGKLNKVQASFMSDVRPEEELYDLINDPHEINNLADNPEFAGELTHHRRILEQWMKETDDKGQYPESREGLKYMWDWWKEKCVNPEYDIFRKRKN